MIARASSPSSATPTSSRSGRAPTARATASRYRGWSSATRTVVRERDMAPLAPTLSLREGERRSADLAARQRLGQAGARTGRGGVAGDVVVERGGDEHLHELPPGEAL